MSTLLEVRDLTVAVGGGRAVDGVSFAVAAGETFALVGESGCGKSMTALALMRLLPAAARTVAGTVRFGGDDMLALSEAAMRQVRGGGMAMIFQEPGTSLNPVMSIGRQIGEALRVHGAMSAADEAGRAAELLTAVGIPDAPRRLAEYPFQFSGGMKQRAMIAMALAGKPRLLIADEPTTALDVTIQAQVLDLLQTLQREHGMAQLLITHDLGVVARMADRVGVMYAGHLVETAPRDVFFARPGHPYARRLFAALPDIGRRGTRLATIPGSVPRLDASFPLCRFLDRCDAALPVCRCELPPWRDHGEGQQVRCHLPARKSGKSAGKSGTDHVFSSPDDKDAGSSGSENTWSVPDLIQDGSDKSWPVPDLPLLSVDNLQVHFPIRRGVFRRTVGRVRAVDGVSLTLDAGRTLALVGESGCGKTTVGKALLRLIEPTAGRIVLDGRELAADTMAAAHAAVQMVFQDPFGSLNPKLRIGAIIAEGMRALGVAGEAAPLLEQVGLAADMAGRYPHEFSGGQRQRIAIARALAVSPRVLILDEPTSALDVSVQAQILNLLADLQRGLGLAYLFITHNIAVVDHLADEVAVMYLGRIVERGTADEVLRAPRHPYTRALLAAVPRLDGARGERLLVPGDPPSPAAPPAGCHFHPRCPLASEACRADYPDERVITVTHRAACVLA